MLVFTNTAPLFNSLSKDRFNVFEVLNEEYNYVIRRVAVRVNVMRYDGKFVEYQYVSEQASVGDIRKLNRKKNFEFTDDEIAMQLLLSTLPHQLFDARFNRSPIHCPSQADTRIWHFHGNKHVNRKSSRDLWLPAYEAVLSENLGDIVSWTPGADKRLDRFLKA